MHTFIESWKVVLEKVKEESDGKVKFKKDDKNCGIKVYLETGLNVISLEEVRWHDTREDGWMVIYDCVYQVTEFLKKHPGGEEVMQEYLGYDATLAFRGVGHSKQAVMMMKEFMIEMLPLEERLGLALEYWYDNIKRYLFVILSKYNIDTKYLNKSVYW
jgi:cytochrome b involved in lipid metabolism